MITTKHLENNQISVAQSDVAVEDTPNECTEYDTKKSDGEAPVMLELLGMWSILYCHCSQFHSGPEWLHLIGSYLWVK